MARRTKSRGPKGLKLEVGAWKVPRLLVFHILYSYFSDAWAKRRFSGAPQKWCTPPPLTLRFNLADFFAPLGPRGVEFSGPIWSPARLFINLANWSFVFVVPVLYAKIYKFRKAHAVTTIGVDNHTPFHLLCHICTYVDITHSRHVMCPGINPVIASKLLKGPTRPSTRPSVLSVKDLR